MLISQRLQIGQKQSTLVLAHVPQGHNDKLESKKCCDNL
jgi:hypothetical protein